MKFSRDWNNAGEIVASKSGVIHATFESPVRQRLPAEHSAVSRLASACGNDNDHPRLLDNQLSGFLV